MGDLTIEATSALAARCQAAGTPRIGPRNEMFYELRLDDEHLHQKNLRLFFWVQDAARMIWIIHGYWKKTNRLDESVKTLVARRIKNLKGAIQDGSIQ